MSEDPPSLAVVVPAHRAEDHIDQCLDGLFAAGFAPSEIVVVDDGSPDATGDRARARGVRVTRNAAPLRPARARNRGVEETDAEIVVFVDADVVVRPGARARIREHFTGADLAAVFGSYDDAPPAPAVVSRYRNLLHHFVHQNSRAEASTFWTGFGAVRRDRFLDLGGFEQAWENIEDVEFGLRLSRAGGRIRLDPGLQATHLKAWTLRSMFLTDLYGRARPWTRLLMRGDAALGDLNTAPEHRASAVAVAAFAVAVALAPFDLAWVWAALGAAAVFAVANRRFFAFLARSRGPGFALACAPYHAAHYLAALSGYALARLDGARAAWRT